MSTESHRERLPVSVSCAVFIEDDKGRLLLLQQASEIKGNKWGPPAGGLEAHEDPTEGAIRECLEETGLLINIVDMIGIYTIDRGNSNTGIGFVYRAKVKSGTIKTREGEIMDFGYFTWNEIQAMVNENKIYKPEYNAPCFRDWLAGKSFPADVVKKIIQ